MSEWPSDVAFIAEVMPDWTTLQLPPGQAFGFNRETGRVYRLPHPDCPFAIIPNPQATRPAPSEEDVEAAAKRMAGVNWSADGERLDRSWDMAREAVRENYRRMARAALGVQS